MGLSEDPDSGRLLQHRVQRVQQLPHHDRLGQIAVRTSAEQSLDLPRTRIGAQEPDRILLYDRRIQFTIVLWLIVYLCVLYADIQIFR